MISDAIRIDVEKWAARKDENPTFMLAREGRLTGAMITRYIANVTYMVRRTPGHLRAARDAARQLGDEPLARHYQHKLDEEDGHAVWGDSDLENLGKTVGTRSTAVTPSISALASELGGIIAEDPALYLTYLAFTEYVTVLLGPEFLSDVEERCGVPRSSMTIIDNHIELDREHAEEGFGVIDELVGDPTKIGPMRRALAQICMRFDGFFSELTIGDEYSEVHVSAA